MASRSGQQWHEYWGTFGARSDLPNVAGAPVQKTSLEVGDYAWVASELAAFRCLDATLGAAQWVMEPWADSTRGLDIAEDWISLSAVGTLGWSTSNAGTAASSQISNVNADSDHLGIVQSDTGNTAAGRSTIYLGTDGLVTPAAGGLMVAEASVLIPTLSTATQEFTSRFLLGDTLTAADHADGIYFEYDRALSGDFWRAKTASNNVRTAVATTAPVVAGAWSRLRAVITPGVIDFFVNDALVASILTTIPTGAARRYAPNMGIRKTVGTTQRDHQIDYFRLRVVTSQVR